MSASRLRSLVKGCCAALLALAVLAACEDAPTAPRAYVHPAEGELWVAITVPPGMPDLNSWIPHLRALGPQDAASHTRVRTLQGEAEQARRAGDLENAHRIEEEAMRVVAASLGSLPDPRVFPRAFTALDSWLDRAEIQLAEATLPQLEEAVRLVRANRRAAESALSAGDTAAAVLHVATASLRVRDQAPMAVALRVIDRANRRLAAQPLDDENAIRARRLLSNAREALLERQDARALQRALYALQIADGHASSDVVDAVKTACAQDGGRCPEP